MSLLWLSFALSFTLSIAATFRPFQAWNVTSSSNTSTQNLIQLSLPGIDTSKWHRIGSKGTLMSALIANDVHKERDLFYSSNLQNVDAAQFQVPWYYRSESFLDTANNTSHYYTLRTNGISSRAEIYLNGQLVADKDTQAGAYVGIEYDVTEKLKFDGPNILLVKAYPTNYNRDFALGFVDWNPYPPDNGTGIWRDVELKRTGQVSLSSPRIKTTLDGSVSVFLDVKNLAKEASASGHIDCSIRDTEGRGIGVQKSGFELGSQQQRKIEVKAKVDNPQIWWPRQWGKQPLYTVQCSATINGVSEVSDFTPVTKFGIRTVSSKLDKTHNDTTFFVNGERFQVLGAGYTSDIFLRFDEQKLRTQFEYVLDMGMNTVRLEGKQEHPFLYDLADEMGIMVLAGWECCDKWEGWSFNDEGSGEKWKDADYRIANLSMRHEAEMMQSHPSILGFLIGSDFWPDDKATAIYVDALKAFDWDTPVLASASQRGAPDLIGNGGMKMDGPYDWVPPNYWYDEEQRLGSAGGFGSELGAGVGTPELGSLKKFLSPSDLDDLWKAPNKGLYHMSTNVSSFYTRQIYNDALWARYGAPTSLEDYLLKAQMMDYEATRAQFEAYTSRWSTNLTRPATGLIYWMLNNAWPSLHWNLFDYYLHPGGSYFGTKASLLSLEHLIYDYQTHDIYLVNRHLSSSSSSSSSSPRRISIDLINLDGSILANRTLTVSPQPNSAVKVTSIENMLKNSTSVSFLRLLLHSNSHTHSPSQTPLSRNTYWLTPPSNPDVLAWENSTWYHTPLTSYANFSSLSTMQRADLAVHFSGKTVVLWNKSKVPAVFVRLNLVDAEGADVLPVWWEGNYAVVWPGERVSVGVRWKGVGKRERDVRVEVSGRNVEGRSVRVGEGGGYGDGEGVGGGE